MARPRPPPRAAGSSHGRSQRGNEGVQQRLRVVLRLRGRVTGCLASVRGQAPVPQDVQLSWVRGVLGWHQARPALGAGLRGDLSAAGNRVDGEGRDPGGQGEGQAVQPSGHDDVETGELGHECLSD